MTLAVYRDGTREHIYAPREGKCYVVPDGPFTQGQLDDIRQDLMIARDAELSGRPEIADQLRRVARDKRARYRDENSSVPLFSVQAVDLVYETRQLTWQETCYMEGWYGPMESGNWRWDGYRHGDENVYFRAEWRLVELECIRE